MRRGGERKLPMQYMLLIYHSEAQASAMSKADMAAQLDAYQAYTNRLVSAGVLRAGDALEPTTTATTVRVRGAETMTVDGPFAETKEQLGGYYLIEVDNLDEALKWAAELPESKTGSVEVRPVMNLTAHERDVRG